ncbi:MAG TPA: hypothetical protein VFR58_16790 [Flavisolibacter sp.]|nr:hypothetical protein [Flavisolibacter sp.]
MERNFTDENFEDFLRQNADGLRMRPSDEVWKGISSRLNKRRRRWLGFGLTVGLMITGSLGYLMTKNTEGSQAPLAKGMPETEKIPLRPVAGSSPASTADGISRTASSEVHTSNPLRIASSNPSSTAFTTNSRPQMISVHAPAIRSSEPVQSGISSSSGANGTNSTALSVEGDSFTPTVVDSYPETEQKESLPAAKLSESQPAKDPLTIESVTNSYLPRARKNKLDFQVFFTPTVSYRRLSDNKAYLRNASAANMPSAIQGLYNVNNMVTHKPAFGFEIGFAAKYPLTSKIKLRGGLQFNINRYDIKTFNSNFQFATIRLNNRDTLSAITNYNNLGGYRSNWLENFYFQVSAPIGVEFKLHGDEDVQFGIATSIQPTYVLGDRAYLLSTDYKNYVEVPWLIRRWNVNTSIETFVSYSTGHLRWQVGPQVRYQVLSSFVKKYPVKENLFDFGLKVGVSVNK